MAVIHCILVFIYFIQSVRALSCVPCEKALCIEPTNCKAGFVKGVCGCCNVCTKVQGEPCGGPWNIHGQCAKGLKCVARGRMRKRDRFLPKYFSTGVCEPAECEDKVCGFRERCKINKRGKPKCICPRKCGRVRQPVCGLLNGRQYRNKCKLEREECLEKKEIGLVPGECRKCIHKGQKYKFGDRRLDAKPCEICICHHGSWKCHMKPNCSVTVTNHSNRERSCLMSRVNKEIVLPCPKDFTCRPSKSSVKMGHVRAGVCKKTSYRFKKVRQLVDIVYNSNSVSPKKEEEPENKEPGYQDPDKISSTEETSEFSFTAAPVIETNSKKQLMKGGSLQQFCLEKVETGTCWPVTLVRWFYHASNKTCEQFKYSGCGGNLNNFLSREECEAVCRSELHNFPAIATSMTTQSSRLYFSNTKKADVLLQMCHDIKTGISYHDNEKWNKDKCTSCTCVNGRALCIAASCQVTCHNPIHVEGKCCPVCQQDVEDSGKVADDKENTCYDAESGLSFLSGESWARSECVRCTCFEGETSCMTSVCAKPLCERPVRKEGGCCPVCPDDEKQEPKPTTATGTRCRDRDNKNVYVSREAWKENDCVSCFCDKQGQSVCHEMQCLEAKCKNPVLLEGRCCPVCPESFLSGCTYDGRQYFKGDFMLLGDMCTLCKCNGNAWNCTKKYCNKTVSGVNSFIRINGEKQNNDRKIPIPTKFSINNGMISEDGRGEENNEFIVEDPIRMKWRSAQKITTQDDQTTTKTRNYITSSPRTPTKVVRHTNELSAGTPNIFDMFPEKVHPKSTDESDSNPIRLPWLSGHNSKMWPSEYEDMGGDEKAEDSTPAYSRKRL